MKQGYELLRTIRETPIPISSREFLARAERHVDEAVAERHAEGSVDVLDYLKAKYPPPMAKPVECRTLPARFQREPDIWLGNIRFGRTRLFLSKFIGDRAWRGWRSL